jgi:hypothetical protein
LTIILDNYPWLSAFVASSIVLGYIGGSIGVVVYTLRKGRSTVPGAEGWKLWALAIFAMVGIAGGIGWWRTWSPWKVELASDAVELHYVWSTARIPYDALDAVEFEYSKGRRDRDSSVLRLSADRRSYKLYQSPEPAGDVLQRPVRVLFDGFASRVPSSKHRDLSMSSTDEEP